MTSTSASLQRISRRPTARGERPPWALLLVTGLVTLGTLLPLVYLALRALEGGLDVLPLLARPRTLELIASTAALGIAVIGFSVGVGVPLAWLTARTDMPGRRGWAAVAIAPLAVPSYLLAFAFVGALAPNGPVAGALAWTGLAGVPAIYGFGGAVLVLGLATTPYVVIAVRAAMMRLDPATEEAARSLGDGPWRALRTAVVPVLVPAVGAGALLACLYAISDFGAVSILRYDTIATAIYSQYRFSFDRSGAATMALLLLALALALVWAEERVRHRAALATPHGRRRVGRTVRLGHWRWPALALTSTVAALSLGLPVVVIASWLWGAIGSGVTLEVGLSWLRDSLLIAAGAAILAVTLSLPLTRLVVRHPGRWSALTERLLYMTYAIPGISLALAFVFFSLNAVPALYQTFLLLVVAIGLRFLVQAVGALRGPMLQVSPRTVEAARSLGEGNVGVLRSVTLPLLRPGLMAGAMLVLLSALKELPLTLLLAPPGTSTLATRLWDAAREAHYAQAAVPALLLLVVSFVSIVLLVRRGEVVA